MSQNGQIVVPSALLDNQVQFIEVSSLLAKRALDEIGVHRQSQKRAADMRGPLLDHMVKSGVVAESRRQAAEAMLGSHAETYSLLKSAVDKIVELKTAMTKKAGDNGESVDPASIGLDGGKHSNKQGEYNSLEDPFVGRKTAFVKESDRKLLTLIGR